MIPTLSPCAVIGHLYAKPEIKQNDKGAYCQIRFWTKDKLKANEEAKFTSWSAWVHGKPAEWLAAGEKGSPVWVSGSIRLDTYKRSDGVESHTIAFTRVTDARLVERQEDGQPEKPVAAPARTAPVHAPYDDSVPF
jgi:single-stranded DNA-binding protein